MSKTLNILDANPLEHLSSDLAVSQYNFESILNGLVAWDSAKMDTVTIRLATNTDPYFVDYTIKTKYAYDTASGSTVSAVGLRAGNYAYREKAAISALYDPSVEKTDKVNVRINAVNPGDTEWGIYADVTIYDETNKDADDIYYVGSETYRHTYVSNLYYKVAEVSEGIPTSIKLYRTLSPINVGDSISSSNSKAVVVNYEDAKVPTTDIREGRTLVYYNGKVYIQNGDLKSQTPPDQSASQYKVYCDEYSSSTTYTYGSYVYFNGSFYVFIGESNSGVAPYTSEWDEDYEQYVIEYNDQYWSEAFFLDTKNKFTNSGVYRLTTESDYSGFVLRNVGTDDSAADTDVRMVTSMKIKGVASVPHSGVNILPTSNYNRWPMNSVRWRPGKTYSTDTEKGVYDLQDYTAVMVFNHADPSVKKTNFINYDGPDLNQGLAVFLPVDVLLDDGSVAEPEDGFMFEYLIRIWPDPSWNNSEVNDLIINKAQVYFYNVSDYTDFDWGSRTFDKNNVQPIAKFSMARLTNFYVFAENVGIPDRPVIYKARFVYSKGEHRWRTYDYYQFPDHVFLSPMGFVDPTAGGDSYAGVETGGFPLFQDPFCGTDLSPVRLTEDYAARIRDEVE